MLLFYNLEIYSIFQFDDGASCKTESLSTSMCISLCMYLSIHLLYVLIFVLRAVKLYFISLFLSFPLPPPSLAEDYDRWERIMSYNFSPCQWHWQSPHLINTVPPAGLWSQLCWKYVLSSFPSTTIPFSAETCCTSQRLLISWVSYSYAISMTWWLHPPCPWV